MDPATLTTLAIYAVPLLFAASVPVVKRLRGRSRLKALERWALDQGLTRSDDGDWQGMLHEQWLSLAHVAGGPVVVSVRLRPALDLGLLIQPLNWNVSAHLEQAKFDDGSFDGVLSAYGSETFRVQQLLSPALRSGLRNLLLVTTGLRLSDGGLQLWLDARRANVALLEQIVDQAATIMSEVERRRMELPAARELAQYLPDWLAFSEDHGLQLSRAPLGLRGTLQGRDVWAVVVRSPILGPTDATHLLDVLVSFLPPLGVALSVTSNDDSPRAMPSGQADPRGFDTAFTVTTKDDRGRNVLDPRLQERLLRTRQRRGPVQLSPNWLWVRIPSLPTQPSQALEIMEEVADLGHAISIAARAAAGGATPYRARQ